MFNSASPGRPGTSIPKSPLPGSIPQPAADEFRGEMVPDWNNIGLFTAGVGVGALLGAGAGFLFAPASGGGVFHPDSPRGGRGSGGGEEVGAAPPAKEGGGGGAGGK